MLLNSFKYVFPKLNLSQLLLLNSLTSYCPIDFSFFCVQGQTIDLVHCERENCLSLYRHWSTHNTENFIISWKVIIKITASMHRWSSNTYSFQSINFISRISMDWVSNRTWCHHLESTGNDCYSWCVCWSLIKCLVILFYFHIRNDFFAFVIYMLPCLIYDIILFYLLFTFSLKFDTTAILTMIV